MGSVSVWWARRVWIERARAPATHGNHHKERRTPTAKFKLLIRLAAEEAREGAEGESVTEMSEHSGCSAVEK